MIDIDIQQELQYELIDDEKLVWTGRPGTGIIFRKIDIFLIPFSLIWFGMIIFVIFGVSTSPSENSNTPWPVFLFLIPFLSAGCYVTFGRFFIDKRRRANTVYGITNDRIIIRSGVFSQKVNSFNIKTLSNLSIDEKSDGTGNIVFSQNNFMFGMMSGMMVQGMGTKFVPSFESIADVRSVYNIILKLQRS
ncbi:PH domain-containing protein [Mucilaginibacter sp. BT774]|uniref:PH domain-containing protein n=1 Tax=Mucilaginibacter sp. BT774 TaxID=3062276 RepID=UPI002676A3C7|nr:PH domain-containing protein [Mucilaginibacter sp. BT774]MDO3624636.1 PH domain-containing protein [Mucilaginibacter sp. BT774]